MRVSYGVILFWSSNDGLTSPQKVLAIGDQVAKIVIQCSPVNNQYKNDRGAWVVVRIVVDRMKPTTTLWHVSC